MGKKKERDAQLKSWIYTKYAKPKKSPPVGIASGRDFLTLYNVF